jgi:hypothetical protein
MPSDGYGDSHRLGYWNRYRLWHADFNGVRDWNRVRAVDLYGHVAGDRNRDRLWYWDWIGTVYLDRYWMWHRYVLGHFDGDRMGYWDRHLYLTVNGDASDAFHLGVRR